MNKGKRIIIVGGGLTGLSAGIHGRLQGYDTCIFEKHSLPGGVCTSWDRKGFTFDGAFHWWLGSVPESPLYPRFEEVGIFPETRVLKRDTFVTLKLEDGDEFTVYTDNEKLKEEMYRIAEEDKPGIDRMFEQIAMMDWSMAVSEKPMDAFSPLDWLAFFTGNAKQLGYLNKYLNITIGEYVKQFSSRKLASVICRIFSDEFPVFVLFSTLAAFNMGDGNFPEGGALSFVRRMEKKYLDLGGEIRYSSGVKSIIVRNNRAAGVELENGEEHLGDWVVSAADGHGTIYDMLGGRFVNEKITQLYENHRIFTPLVQVSLGINADLSARPHCYGIYEPDNAAGNKVEGMWLRHYCYDRTLAPAGKSVVTALIGTSWDDWKDVDRASSRYRELKDAYAGVLIRYAARVYPETEGRVETVDVATPLTTLRYTGNWKASYEGWLPVKENLTARVPKTLPGLKNFRMAGQWTEPGGGIPTAVMLGRTAVYMICKADKRKWKIV